MVGADQGASEGFFGERAASLYDERSAGMSDPEVVAPAVQMLAEFAGGGGALEFGIGTGRIALPLAERGARLGVRQAVSYEPARAAGYRARPNHVLRAILAVQLTPRTPGHAAVVDLTATWLARERSPLGYDPRATRRVPARDATSPDVTPTGLHSTARIWLCKAKPDLQPVPLRMDPTAP